MLNLGDLGRPLLFALAGGRSPIRVDSRAALERQSERWYVGLGASLALLPVLRSATAVCESQQLRFMLDRVTLSVSRTFNSS